MWAAGMATPSQTVTAGAAMISNPSPMDADPLKLKVMAMAGDSLVAVVTGLALAVARAKETLKATALVMLKALPMGAKKPPKKTNMDSLDFIDASEEDTDKQVSGSSEQAL